MAITDNAGNVYSQIYGAQKNQRAPIQTMFIPSITTVGASTTQIVANIVVPGEPGKIKFALKGIRWQQGGAGATLGSGISYKVVNVTNSSKSAGAVTATANTVTAYVGTHADCTGVLASTTTDRSVATPPTQLNPSASPATSATEPDINVVSGDTIGLQIVTLAGASATGGTLQVDYQWLDNF